MTHRFNPFGNLNVAVDASDLPEAGDDRNTVSDAMVRCKNMRLNERGKAITRDGSQKLNATAINPVSWIEEFDGKRFSFGGTEIYQDESAIASGLTDAEWTGFQYNSFNDVTKQIFATNGTDRKRITDGAVNEWGLEAPTTAPTLTSGGGTGLTGLYNVVYTYARKIGGAIVHESNPSPPATNALQLNNQSLAVEFAAPTDPQVTHVRIYRTLAGGEIYFFDQDVEAAISYAYGYSHPFEADEGYVAGTGFKFTITDVPDERENTFSWETVFETQQVQDTAGNTSGTTQEDYEDEYEFDSLGDREYELD